MAAIAFYTSNIVISSTAVALSTSQAATQLVVQVDPTLSAGITVRIGNVSGQFLAFSAGGSLTIPISNVSQVYAIASGGSATLNWLAHTAWVF